MPGRLGVTRLACRARRMAIGDSLRWVSFQDQNTSFYQGFTGFFVNHVITVFFDTAEMMVSFVFHCSEGFLGYGIFDTNAINGPRNISPRHVIWSQSDRKILAKSCWCEVHGAAALRVIEKLSVIAGAKWMA